LTPELKGKVISFEELHLWHLDKGFVRTEQETKIILGLLCYQKLLQKQVFDDNTIWYRINESWELNKE